MGLVIGLRSGTSGVAMQFPEWFINDAVMIQFSPINK